MNAYKVFLLVLLSCIAFESCNKNDKIRKDEDIIFKPKDKDSSSVKTIQMWIDVHANFTRFATKDSIIYYLNKMKEYGFNEVYVDVKPGIGYALYDSKILPKLTKWGNKTVNRDWDYLDFWIKEGKKNGISVIASIVTLGYGYPPSAEGLVYDSNKWNGKTQKEMPKADNPDNIEDIKNQKKAVTAMLNPCLPEVKSFVVSIAKEIVEKYPDLKGICLDYCRWYGGNYGFGEETLSAFRKYSGVSLKNKNQIITQTGGIGPLYKNWIEFRSIQITNIITKINETVKAVNPKIEIHLWGAAHWKSRYLVGQNWASKKYYPPSSGVYTTGYNETGFANQIDVFSLGAYTENVWTSDAPGSEWSVENFVTDYNKYIKEDCKVYGSLGTYAYKNNSKQVSDAVSLALKYTKGVMVFEISHVIHHNQWDAIKRGIEMYKKQNN